MTDNNQQPNTPPAGDTGTQPGGATPNQATTPERTFTQGELDRIIADRLSQQKRSIESQFADYPTLQEKAAKWAEYENSQKTETQRIQDEANAKVTELQTKVTALETERTTLSSTARAALTKAAVLEVASEQGVIGKQLIALYKLVPQSELEFDDKGEVKNAAEVVTKVIGEYPFLKTPETPQQKPSVPKISPTNPAGTNTQPDLSWHPLNRRNESSFQRGGVIPPVGEK